MNRSLFKVSLLSVLMLLLATGCSTTANFKIPSNTRLTVYDRPTPPPTTSGDLKVRPFFWSAAGGIPYRLEDSSGKVIRQGELKSRFRIVSIFWPPFALIYWPIGFGSQSYDLTMKADGYYVRDTVDNSTLQPAPVAPSKKK